MTLIGIAALGAALINVKAYSGTKKTSQLIGGIVLGLGGVFILLTIGWELIWRLLQRR
jgi:hypothetical protein